MQGDNGEKRSLAILHGGPFHSLPTVGVGEGGGVSYPPWSD